MVYEKNILWSIKFSVHYVDIFLLETDDAHEAVRRLVNSIKEKTRNFLTFRDWEFLRHFWVAHNH